MHPNPHARLSKAIDELGEAKATQTPDQKTLEALGELVNEKLLHDAAEEIGEQLPGMRTPDARTLKKIQEYAVKYKRKNPNASEARVTRAACRKFNLDIVPEPRRKNDT